MGRRITNLRNIFKEYWFLMGIFMSIVLAELLPGFGIEGG